MPATLPCVLLAVLTLAAGGAAVAAELTVSAAASLADAMRELAPRFEAAQPGTRLQFNFGASGALLQQIARGAPVDVFASADESTMDRAQAAGWVWASARHDFATNTLVLVVPAAGTAAPRSLADLTGLRRIAIGQPSSVPAGRYAREALEAAGLWATVQARTIGTQSVRQALDVVARDEVDAGFVYATDAALMPGKVRVALRVPTTTPIRYPIAALAASRHADEAERFVQFMLGPEARAVLARYGFSTP
jgi:molybdate transport system substrate-binding protein